MTIQSPGLPRIAVRSRLEISGARASLSASETSRSLVMETFSFINISVLFPLNCFIEILWIFKKYVEGFPRRVCSWFRVKDEGDEEGDNCQSSRHPSWLFSTFWNINLLAGETVDNTFKAAVVYFSWIFLFKNSDLDHLSWDRLACLELYKHFTRVNFHLWKRKEKLKSHTTDWKVWYYYILLTNVSCVWSFHWRVRGVTDIQSS